MLRSEIEDVSVAAEAPSLCRHVDDARLIVDLVSGDSQAWNLFYKRYKPSIMRTIVAVLRSCVVARRSDDAEEVFSVLMLSLQRGDMRRLRTFDVQRGVSLSTFLSVIARNCTRDYLRARRRRASSVSYGAALESLAYDGDPLTSLLARERWLALNRAARELSTRDVEFMRLFYVEACPAERIAKSMSISVNTVYSKRHKITERLMTLVANDRATVPSNAAGGRGALRVA